MRKLTLVALALTSLVSFAAPISPIEGYNTTTHNQYELDTFWKEIASINRRMKGEDCFKRAMIWSYKLNEKYGVKTKKVFMHYTDKFNHELDDQGRTGLGAIFGRIVSSNDGWDFHVAPAVNINGQDMILDPHLTKGPKTVENWVDFLTERGERLLKKRHYDLLKDLRKYSRKSRNSADRDRYRRKAAEIRETLKRLGLTTNPDQKVDIKCQKITHIMEFDRSQQDAWCFYQETSQYYFGPLELRYLNYGNINWDKRLPVTDLSFHNENSYADGRNYVVRDWDYEKLENSLDEYKMSSRPKTIRDI